MLFFRTFILTPRYLKISPWWKFVQELIQTRAVFANCHISLFTDLLIRKGRKSNWRCSKLRFVKDRYVLASTFGRRKAFWRVIYSATGSSANPIKNNTQSNRYSIFTLCSVRSVFYHKILWVFLFIAKMKYMEIVYAFPCIHSWYCPTKIFRGTWLWLRGRYVRFPGYAIL